ncbi:MAG: hypothetical protein ABEJ05_05105 [Haloglomus sp.]
MSSTLVDDVWKRVQARVGDDLRVVTRYEATDFETRMRDDVRDQYTTTEDHAIVTDTILKQLGSIETESAFKAGELHALIRVFDDAYVLSWGDKRPRKSGFIISVDRTDRKRIRDLDWCIEMLNEDISPQID